MKKAPAMDGTTSRDEEKAPPPAGDCASSEQQQPASPLQPAGVNPGDDAAAKVETGGGEEDEQVERFFALLANIRALRRVYGTAIAGGGGSTDCGGESRRRKRAREAEPPWRPAFRLEDFEPQEERAGNGKKMWGGVRRPAVTASSTGTGAAGDEDEGEVVETRGCPVAASQRASDDAC